MPLFGQRKGPSTEYLNYFGFSYDVILISGSIFIGLVVFYFLINLLEISWKEILQISINLFLSIVLFILVLACDSPGIATISGLMGTVFTILVIVKIRKAKRKDKG